MYASYKNVQVLVALLKKKGIRHVVMSPGGGDMPIVRSIESDSFFTCYSVVDERSAAYFTVGLGQSLKEPVAAICTSGTAVLNYLSGASEAFYQRVPIVFITADRHPYLYRQLETQTLNQAEIFKMKDVCRKSVNLPIVKDDDDFWYCQRLINEALLELSHHGSGPVHINIPTGIAGMPLDFSVTELPEVRLINRILESDSSSKWEEKIRELKAFKRILVVFGQGQPCSAQETATIERFFSKYNCVLSVEHLSNINCEGTLSTYPLTEVALRGAEGKLLPDLVISLGNNFSSAFFKTYLRKHKGQFEHWLIDETGDVKDVFKSLSFIFESSPAYFFGKCVEHAPEDIVNDKTYYGEWENALHAMEMPDFPYSSMYVAGELSKIVPANSILHLGILNSTRQMQFYDLQENVEVFSNIGALGIDGSMSTLIGQSVAAPDKLCFLLIGDLSFFYDMNSLTIRHIKPNVRIVMVNNRGGAEFQLNFGKKAYPNIAEFISAGHNRTAQAWAEAMGFTYYAAHSKEELDDGFSRVVSTSEHPVFLEIFTDMEEDGELLRAFYAQNRSEAGTAGKGKTLVKNVVKTILGDSAKDRLKKGAKQ